MSPLLREEAGLRWRERTRQHCFLWAGVASWDSGSCEVLLSLQNPAESPISVKVSLALDVPSDPPQSTCWEKPSLHHQQVRLQHRLNSTVGQCWALSLTLRH